MRFMSYATPSAKICLKSAIRSMVSQIPEVLVHDAHRSHPLLWLLGMNSERRDASAHKDNLLYTGFKESQTKNNVGRASAV